MIDLEIDTANILSLDQKYENLKAIIKGYQSVVIGLSGGVDSTFLSKVSYDTLGHKALAVIGISPSLPKREESEAISFAHSIGIPFVTIETEEMMIDGYRQNNGNRCYYCKKELYSKLETIKNEHNFNYLLDGTNYSDLQDHRPGLKATEELDVKKPLVEAKLTKEDIRLLSKQLELQTWDKPSFACLSSRFPDGTEITESNLGIVEQGEQILYNAGFKQFRLRYHQDIARIELLESDFAMIVQANIRNPIVQSLRQLGFKHIALDLSGYDNRKKKAE